MYNTTPLPEQKPIAYKFVPPGASHSKMLSKVWTPLWGLGLPDDFEDAGCAGIYPCYSLVEDTECI